ncbi:MAG: head-tail connector protein [Pseudomonadota bacterium]|nr:head-tail connector protein [Pseudomonadota bacterium]
MWLNLSSAPAETPVTLAEAKAHLRVLYDHDDDTITALIAAATGLLDGRHGILGRALVTQSWEFRLNGFPHCAKLELPLPPLRSVTSVKYIDPAGDEQTLSTDDYVVDAATYVGQIRLGYEKAWPATRCEDHAVRIIFAAGFGAGSEVPMALRQAMLLMIGHWYANREAVSETSLSEVPMAAKWLFAPYRIQAF